MSRSKLNRSTEHIAKRTLEWKGSRGCWRFYDRDAREERTIEAKAVSVMVLDKNVKSVTGYSKKHRAGIWSNEISRNDEVLTVRCGDKIIAEGTWGEIQDTVKAAGGKWTQVLYSMDSDGEIIRLLLAGSGLGNFIDLKNDKTTNVEGDFAIYVKGVEDGQKGAVKFQIPVWALKPVKDNDALNKATECDRRLQSFLARRREKAGQTPVQKSEAKWGSQEHPPTAAMSEPPPPVAPKVELEEELDEIPF